ncbi:MAG: SDR family oxidoreductase [Patescibacteria group bacterium]
MKSLKDKVAVITGGNDGIGKQIALKLSKKGVKLALVARNEEKLKTTADEIGADVAHIYVCDIKDSDQRKETVDQILKDFSGIDILINNAGIIHKLMPLEEMDEELIDDIIQTNLTGLILFTKLLLPTLKSSPEAAIINISSIAGILARPGFAAYSASKYGVRGFTDVLKADLKETNIKVAGMYQGGVNTDLFNKAGDTKRPLESYTEPDDLAEVISFMLSQPDKCWLHEIHVAH